MARLREFARGDWTPPRWYTLTAFWLAVVVLASTLLGGCKVVTLRPNSGGDAGSVVERSGVSGKRKLEVKRDSDGTTFWFHVRNSTWRKCEVGAHWPECQRGSGSA